MINFLGCSFDRLNYKELIQKFLNLKKTEICDTCQNRMTTNTLRIFDCKKNTCQELYRQLPMITDNLCQLCRTDWMNLQELLSLLSVSYQHNPYLVRGLDYYNGTAFEFSSTLLGAQSSFCGGGRYDGLVTQFEPSKKVSALGAAFGIERLALLIESQKLLFKKEKLCVIISLSQEQMALSLLCADQLRNNGISVQLFFEGSLKTMMKQADKINASFVVCFGQTEQETGTASFKNMHTGILSLVKQSELVSLIQALL